MSRALTLRRSIVLATLTSLLLGATAVTGLVTRSSSAAAAACNGTKVRPQGAVASTEEAINPAAHAVDNSLGTRWSGLGSGAHLTLELARSHQVCQVGIAWHRGDLRWNDFSISLSTDNVTYRKAWEGRSSGRTAEIEFFPLTTPAAAKYIRITFKQNPENTWASISEALAMIGGTDPEPVPDIKPVKYWIDRYDQAAAGEDAKYQSLTRSADSWNHYDGAYGIEAAVAAFAATGRSTDLNRFLNYSENLVRSSSVRSDGKRGWVSQRSDVRGQEVPLFESYAWRYVAHGLDVLKNSSAYTNPTTRKRYDDLLAFLEVNIFDKWVGRNVNSYVYRVNTHMAAHWGFIAMEVSRLTANAARRDKAIKVRDDVNDHMPNNKGLGIRDQLRLGVVDSDSYFFDMNFGSTTRPGSDVAHGNGVVSYLAEAATLGGQGWSRAELDGFGHLLTDLVIPRGAAYVDGTGAGTGWLADGFVKLGRFDVRVQKALETHKVQGQQLYMAQMAYNAKVLLGAGQPAAKAAPAAAAQLDGNDPVDGVAMMYPSKPGGQSWHLTANPGQDSRLDGPALTKNPDGTFKVRDPQTRLSISTTTFDQRRDEPNLEWRQPTLRQRGFMHDANDWRNVEITGYVRYNAGSDDTDAFTWYARGSRHTGSGAAPEACWGTAYKGNLRFGDGAARFEKEIFHDGGAGYVADKYANGGATLKKKLVGFKTVMYNIPGGVRMEMYLDRTNSNNWTKVAARDDVGSWKVASANRCQGSQSEVISWGGPKAVFRWDAATDVDVTKLSVREIAPGGVQPPACSATAAAASATASTWEAVNPPAQAIDGNLTTRWSGQGSGAALILDLGSVQALCGTKVAWHKGSTRWNDYTVYTSTDGTTYSKAWEGRSTGTTNALETRLFPVPREGRFVKISFWGNPENDWASVTEAAVLRS
ncbi:discoidin domain-containing protein [Kribbella sp. NPDC056861]|uniref:discoidin domain-containing protein n=1 Tax=Kribbella sp. NPDC056861 TaxID=3154857 RepID=UPI00342D5820